MRVFPAGGSRAPQQRAAAAAGLVGQQHQAAAPASPAPAALPAVHQQWWAPHPALLRPTILGEGSSVTSSSCSDNGWWCGLLEVSDGEPGCAQVLEEGGGGGARLQPLALMVSQAHHHHHHHDHPCCYRKPRWPVFVRCWVVTLKYLFMLRQRNVW